MADDDNDWRAPVLDEDGQVVEQNPPPLTITGILQDAAKPQPSQGTSLGLLMNDHQQHDAGIGAPAVASQNSPQDGGSSAEGLARVAEGMEAATSGSHALGYYTGLAAGATKEAPLLKGLEHLNNAYAYPLIGLEGIAKGVDEVQKGAPWEDALIGNLARTGLVGAATFAGDSTPAAIVGGFMAGKAADKALPPGSVIGHRINTELGDPEKQRAMLMALQ